MKQPASKHKVLIIFPRFNASDATHYPYWYSLFNEAGKQLDLAILFESGTGSPDYFSHLTSIRIQIFQSKPLNLLERIYFLIHYVSLGYANIYIHYSYWSVVISWLLKSTLFRSKMLTIYYWDCEKYESKPKNIMLEIALRLTDVLVTGHEAVATAYRRVFHFTKPIKIVPNWVDEVRGTKYRVLGSEYGVRSNRSENPEPITPNPELTHILFVHHISPRKGSRELPGIITHTLASVPNAHFHIVGEGPDLGNLKFQITKLKHEKSVTFHGSLTHEQIAALYKTAAVFIMPSRSEGFPRVILEAMSYGLPIVSTDVGCVWELFGPLQREFICKSDQFPEKIVQLLTRADLETIAQENKALAREYNLSKAFASYILLFSHGRSKPPHH